MLLRAVYTNKNMERRVVITGSGIWSCLGTNLATVLESLQNGRSGIGIDPARKEIGFQSFLTGVVERPQLKGLLDRRTRVGLPEEGEYAYMASREAFESAGITPDYLAEHECGCIFGNDSTAEATIQAAKIVEEKRDTSLLGSGWIFQSMNSTVTMNISTTFGLRGINFTVSAACASGSHAIGLGYLLIKQGLQNLMLCGGAQEVNPYSMASFDALSAFSKRMASPTEASRPFDRDRDGLIPSGGAAALVLEEYEHAKARGANILCEVVGYGFSGNGCRISEPSVTGSEIAMRRALDMAQLQPSDVDYINAHATSTPQGDAIEAQALHNIFHSTKPWISSTKSMTGHECWMAGASEIVYSLLMLNNQFVAPNINFENPDEYSKQLNIARETVTTPLKIILSNSFGFGGTNSALVIRAL